jgi:DNA mismatch repair protein MutS
MASEIVKTPLMKQYFSIKAKHPDAILLFRVGDFYETFGEDAIKASKILGITLTRRANGAASFVELAGFPYHSVEMYLPKLVRAGQRVAICEQLEDPKMTKTIVKRGVTEMITPGVTLNDNVLEHKKNNFLASIHITNNNLGIAFIDISTGEFYTSQGNANYINKLLNSYQPKEILYERSKHNKFTELFGDKFYTFKLEDWTFNFDNAYQSLIKQFSTKNLKGFGIENMENAIIASGAIMQYLEIIHNNNTKHITNISRIEEEKYVWLDKFTIKNLELFGSLNEGANTLVDIMDKTVTPMGGRMIRNWIALPLKNIAPILDRQNVVEFFVTNTNIKDNILKSLQHTGDLERIISKIAVGKANPRDILQLKRGLEIVAEVKQMLTSQNNQVLKKISDNLNECNAAKQKIETEINIEAPNLINKGNVINSNVNADLDELRQIKNDGKSYIQNMQDREIAQTNIPSLKISFNNVFGYYIEVRNTHKDKVPQEWVRKQTLTGAERYITEELKNYETKILGAEEKILAIELQIYTDLITWLTDYIQAIQLNSKLLAQLDCLLSFSNIAIDNNYTKPEINDSLILDIKEGRHPVIEKQLPIDEKYVANNVFLDNSEQQIIIITGPNMSGKSALLRQTALIVLMAQVGSFVPVKAATIGIVDKIFTRVGASDNISMGESTFMVEMTETAGILNNISERSLILLDEIGRGTSTYDGISIAWSIVEYIHEHPKYKAKTLFATHYHELNEMEKSFKRVHNFNVTVKELENKVIFLRKLMPGGVEHSFGIHVAQMAGMPKSVVERANIILKEMETGGKDKVIAKNVKEIAQNREGYQLSFFQLDDPVLKQIKDEIKGIDINNLTPVQALNKLNDIKKFLGK